ncbi:MAG: phage holin family protein [Deltaproteobacteria bacterium]|nr:phage holin family protein [Deltaproteobacteria bacterium]
MKGLMIRWLILALAVMLASYLISGIRVDGFLSALIAAALLAFLNAFFRPILLILTLPINLLSLGLFTFAINAFLLMMVSGVIDGFYVESFGAGLLGSLVISLVSWLLSSFINDRGQVEYITMQKGRDGHWK